MKHALILILSLFFLQGIQAQEQGEKRTGIIPVQDSMFIISDTTFQTNKTIISLSFPIDSAGLKAVFYNAILRAYFQEGRARQAEYEARRTANQTRQAMDAVVGDDYASYVNGRLDSAYTGRWRVAGDQIQFINFDTIRRGYDDEDVLTYRVLPLADNLIRLKNLITDKVVEMYLIKDGAAHFVGEDDTGAVWRMRKID